MPDKKPKLVVIDGNAIIHRAVGPAQHLQPQPSVAAKDRRRAIHINGLMPKPQSWQRNRQRYVLQTPWLSVREDHYREPNGARSKFYVVERPDFVVVVPRTADGRYLLVSQFRHGVGRTVRNFPMGSIAAGERPQTAAKRELREETGATGGRLTVIGRLFLAPALMATRAYVVTATRLRLPLGRPAPTDGEIDRCVAVTADTLQRMIRRGQLADLISVGAYLWQEKAARQKTGGGSR